MQNPARVQFENFQQQRIRGSAVSEREPRLRGRLRVDADVHHPHELRQGLGRRVPAAERHGDALLDRDSLERTVAMVGPGSHSNGLAERPLFVHVLRRHSKTKKKKESKFHEDKTLFLLPMMMVFPDFRFQMQLLNTYLKLRAYYFPYMGKL